MVLKVVYLTDEKIPYEEAHAHFKEAADWAKKTMPKFCRLSRTRCFGCFLYL